MEKITPFLWFDHKAEEAAKFYISIFKNSKIFAIARYDESSAKASGRPKGSVMTVAFQIEGQKFTGINGGPQFKFSPAISFVIDCKTQKELDTYWEKLSSGGGTKGQCGWLTDKYGVSWQVVPSVLSKFMQSKDPKKSQRVMQAILQMTKINIEQLEEAYKG